LTIATRRPKPLRLGRDTLDESHGIFADQNCHSPL
jgi:hypothetical protein